MLGTFSKMPYFKAFYASTGVKHIAYQLGIKDSDDDKMATVALNLGNDEAQVHELKICSRGFLWRSIRDVCSGKACPAPRQLENGQT